MANKQNKSTKTADPAKLNITEIVKEINKSAETLTTLMGNINQIAEAASGLGVKTKIKLAVAGDIIDDYMAIVVDMLSNLQKKFKDGKTITNLLHYQQDQKEVIQELNKNTKKQSTRVINGDGKFQVIEAISGIAIALKNMMDPLKDVITDPGLILMMTFLPKKTKEIIETMTGAITTIIIDIVKGLTRINIDKLQKVTDILVGNPEVVEEELQKNEEGVPLLDKDGNAIKTTKTKGKTPGLIEVLTGLVGIVQSIPNAISLNPITLILTKIKIAIFKNFVQDIVSGVTDIFSSLNMDKDGVEKMEKIANAIQSIFETLTTLEMPSFAEMLILKIRLAIFRRMVLSSIKAFFIALQEFTNKPTGYGRVFLEENGVASKLDAACETLKTLDNLVSIIFKMNFAKVLLAIVNTWMLRGFLLATSGLFKSLMGISFDEKDSQQVITKLSNMGAVIDKLKNLLVSIALAGLLVLPAIIGALLIRFGMKILKHLLKSIVGTLDSIGGRVKHVSSSASKAILLVMILCATMLIICVTLLGIAVMFDLIIDKADSLLKGLGMIALVILGMVAVMLLIGLVAPFVVMGAIATVIVVGCIVLVLVELMLMMGLLMLMVYLAALLDPDAILSAVDLILSTAQLVIQRVLQTDFAMRDSAANNTGLMGFAARLLFGGQGATIVDLMLKCSILFLTIIAVGLLLILSTILLMTVDIGKEVAEKQQDIEWAVINILDTAQSVIHMLLAGGTKKDKEGNTSNVSGDFGTSSENHGLLGWALEKVGGGQFVAILDIASKVVILLGTIIVVGLLYAITHILLAIKEDYDQISGQIGALPNMVGTLMNTVSIVISKITNAGISFQSDKEKKDNSFFGKIKKAAHKVLPNLTDIFDAIGVIGKMGMIIAVLGMVCAITKTAAETFDVLSKYDGKTAGMGAKTTNLMNAVKDAIKAINGSKIGDEINGLSTLYSHSQKFTQFVETTSKLVTNINKINIDKIRSMTNLLTQAAAFAKSMNGNIDRLANAIAEKLEPILKELTKAIEDADKHIEERAKNAPESTTSKTTTTTTATQTSVKSAIEQKRAQEQATRTAQIKMQQQKANNQKLAQDIADALMGVTLRVKMA